jgi:hypothetical protein
VSISLHDAREFVISMAAEGYASDLRRWLVAAEKSGWEQGIHAAAELVEGYHDHFVVNEGLDETTECANRIRALVPKEAP